MDTQRNSHGMICSNMLSVAWRDWKKINKTVVSSDLNQALPRQDKC